MSLFDDGVAYQLALQQAHEEFPLKDHYQYTPDECYHDFSFVVYCNGEQDIVRCQLCGEEKVCRCNFDDDFS